MTGTFRNTTDAVEEFRIRSWARQHFVPRAERDPAWHPMILDEMRRKDRELEECIAQSRIHSLVPLAPDAVYQAHAPHASIPPAPKLLLSVNTVDSLDEATLKKN